ncbi:MAG: thioredoxin family protein [Oscillospiraceae bacterium]|nr:thioredoxin family protein [Oscillospiraceae bacterium]
MAFFNFGKKKNKEEPAAPGCCCGGNCAGEPLTQTASTQEISDTQIKILGSGCVKCNQLESAVKEAVAQLGLSAAIGHVTDFGEIAAYGVMTTPALVVNSKVVSYGKVLKKDEVIKLLQKELK